MPVALCIRCGSWKQSPVQRCQCGFSPARGTRDEAKSVVLSDQFRGAPGELEELARMIRAGEPVPFDEGELARARRIGSRNTAVNLSLLAIAVLLGVLMGGVFAGLSRLTMAALVVALAVAVVITRALMRQVERGVERHPSEGA